MPRQARILLENTPHHIVQRGHNREVVFIENDDYHYYLHTLKAWKQELGAKVYKNNKSVPFFLLKHCLK